MSSDNARPQDARAQDIALALMGAGTLDPAMFAEDAQWQRHGQVLAGRLKIAAALKRMTPPSRIEVDQVVTQGRSGSVSGRYWTENGDAQLFCHVLRFTSQTGQELAQIVSFEHG